MHPYLLRKNIIRPVLKELGYYSKEAENLLVGTACAESLCGQYRRQLGGGPAFGIYQMEKATAYDILQNYLTYRMDLKKKVIRFWDNTKSLEQNLETNDEFATAMCRVHYLRVPAAIPKRKKEMGDYWKEYYNTKYGKGSASDFLTKWNTIEGGIL